MKLHILTVFLAVCSASPVLVSTARAEEGKVAFVPGYSLYQQVEPDYKIGKFFNSKVGLKAPENSLWNSKTSITSEASGSPECKKTELGTGLKVNKFGIIGYKAGALAACSMVKKDVENRFTQENCQVMETCATNKTTVDEPNRLSIYDIPMMIAQDLFGYRFEIAAEKMEKVERARIYIEKKFGKKMAQQCKPRFINSDPLSCNKEMMDSAFKRYQDHCSPMKLSCYNGAISSPVDYKKAESSYENNKSKNESGNFTVTYLNNRSEAAINESLTSDEDLVQGLNQISGLEQSADAKLKSIYEFISAFIAKGKLDPILGFGSRNDNTFETFKKSPHFKFFETLSQSKSNSAAIRKSLDKYRNEIASDIVQECNSTPSYETLCEESTRTSLAKKVNLWNNSEAASHIGIDNDEARFQSLKNFFPNGVRTYDDFKIVMDSYRCKAFRFDRPDSSIADIPFMYDEISRIPALAAAGLPKDLGSGLTPNYVEPLLPNSPLAQLSSKKENDFSNSVKYFLGEKANIGPMVKEAPTVMAETTGPNASAVKAAKADEPAKPIAGASQAAAAEKIKGISEESGTLTSNFAEGFKQTAGALNNSDLNTGNQINSNFNTQTHATIERDQVVTDSPVSRETKKASSADAGSINDKIADLTKKLNSSEENLERMRIEKAAEEVKATNLKKAEDEQKTIAELRDQIKNLRTEAKKEMVVPAEKIQPVDEVAQGSGSLMKAAQVESETTGVKAAAPVLAPHSENNNSASQTSNVSSEAAQSAAMARSLGAGAGSSSAISNESRLSLVLSKTDSLSNEKIYEKIYELKGERFLIEEGGIVKEIKPLVVNNEIVTDKSGKPIFETVVLGDKNTFLKDKKATKTTSKKTAVSLKSKADLMRDQEEKLKYEHAQYLKLKKITNDIWNKK